MVSSFCVRLGLLAHLGPPVALLCHSSCLSSFLPRRPCLLFVRPAAAATCAACTHTVSVQAGRFALAVTVMVLASAVHGMPATAKVAKLEPADDTNGYMPEVVIEAPGGQPRHS